jgi:hypothetical protein
VEGAVEGERAQLRMQMSAPQIAQPSNGALGEEPMCSHQRPGGAACSTANATVEPTACLAALMAWPMVQLTARLIVWLTARSVALSVWLTVRLATRPTVRPTVRLTAPLLAQRTAQLAEQPMVRPSATFVGAANSAVDSATGRGDG